MVSSPECHCLCFVGFPRLVVKMLVKIFFFMAIFVVGVFMIFEGQLPDSSDMSDA